MNDAEIHDLVAGYALDALNDDERDSFEDHLATCEACRTEISDLSKVAAMLVYALQPVSPPRRLRGRIIDAARQERPSAQVAARQRSRPHAPLAIVAGCAALALAIWNIALHDQLRGTRSQTLRHIPVSGATGTLVVASNHTAALILADVKRAPAGSTYEVWITHNGAPSPANLFDGGTGDTYIPLAEPLRHGDNVTVTLEPAAGTQEPTRRPLITSDTV